MELWWLRVHKLVAPFALFSESRNCKILSLKQESSQCNLLGFFNGGFLWRQHFWAALSDPFTFRVREKELDQTTGERNGWNFSEKGNIQSYLYVAVFFYMQAHIRKIKSAIFLVFNLLITMNTPLNSGIDKKLPWLWVACPFPWNRLKWNILGGRWW